MSVDDEIASYLAGLADPKRGEMEALHALFLQVSPGCRLWFADGKDDAGKVVANPSVGYGSYTIRYADGSSKEFYRVGLSANTGGISVYILGLEDKEFLSKTYGPSLGKAKVTSYCIKFKSVKDIDLSVLEAAARYALGLPS